MGRAPVQFGTCRCCADASERREPRDALAQAGANFTLSKLISTRAHAISDARVRQVWIHMRRQALLSYRDPTLYLSRIVMFMITSIFFAWVYVQARVRTQDQARAPIMIPPCSLCAASLGLVPCHPQLAPAANSRNNYSQVVVGELSSESGRRKGSVPSLHVCDGFRIAHTRSPG